MRCGRRNWKSCVRRRIPERDRPWHGARWRRRRTRPTIGDFAMRPGRPHGHGDRRMPNIFRTLAVRALLAVLACTAAGPVFAAAAPGSADASFEALGARYVNEFGRYAPVSATQLGDHRFDAELDDVSAAGRARTLAWVKELLGELAADRSRRVVARQPGRRGDAREPAPLLRLVGGEVPRLVLGPAALHAAGGAVALRTAGARIRAAARAPALA